jgi:hypothetical protein
VHAASARALSAASVLRTSERGHAVMDDRARMMFRAAVTFGVVAATIEIGIVLWMMYC